MIASDEPLVRDRERLRAKPETPLCLDCQGELEQR